MLLFFTPRNCATFKYKVYNMLSILNGNIIGFNVFPMFWADVSRKKHPPCLWWKNLDDIYIGTLWKQMCGIPHSK